MCASSCFQQLHQFSTYEKCQWTCWDPWYQYGHFLVFHPLSLGIRGKGHRELHNWDCIHLLSCFSWKVLMTQEGINSGFSSDDKIPLHKRQQTCGNLQYLYVYMIICVHVLIFSYSELLSKYLQISSTHMVI